MKTTLKSKNVKGTLIELIDSGSSWGLRYYISVGGKTKETSNDLDFMVKAFDKY